MRVNTAAKMASYSSISSLEHNMDGWIHPSIFSYHAMLLHASKKLSTTDFSNIERSASSYKYSMKLGNVYPYEVIKSLRLLYWDKHCLTCQYVNRLSRGTFQFHLSEILTSERFFRQKFFIASLYSSSVTFVIFRKLVV